MKKKIKEEKQNIEDIISGGSENKFLVLHNDDIHTFDEVIDALIDICKHQQEQAVQCTYLVHYKGKAEVKKGNSKFLETMQLKLIERGLKATIE